jgi:hypothetical protein
MIDMENTATTNDVAGQISEALESRDAARLTELNRAVSLVAAEKTAMEAESKRLAKKYGENSKPATEATARTMSLAEQHASFTADAIRASIPTPALDASTFVVYGRVLDVQGNGVSNAKVAAMDPNGASLASSTTKHQGAFELRVPLQSRRKILKKEGEPAAADIPVSFQLVVTEKSLERPYHSTEILTGASGRLAYRDITLPDTSKTAKTK